jgi:hypothetical protein
LIEKNEGNSFFNLSFPTKLSSKISLLTDLNEKIKAITKVVALMTGVLAEIKLVNRYHEILVNRTSDLAESSVALTTQFYNAGARILDKCPRRNK